jgi:hypothetical protein
MEYTITHSINENVIHIQVIHNKTNTYYESSIENTDIHRQIFENINNMELNFHICDTKLFLFFDYNGKSYDFEINKKDINTVKFNTLEAKYNALKDETTVQYNALKDKYNVLKDECSLQFKTLQEKQIKNICRLRRNILKLEQQIQINEDQQPIVFNVMYTNNNTIFDSNFSHRGSRSCDNTSHFYKKSELICDGVTWESINNYLNKLVPKIDLLRLNSKIQKVLVIIPPRKIMKVWINIKSEPTYYTCGIHELSLDKVMMIWLGIEKCKDDIPDNLIELANK